MTVQVRCPDCGKVGGVSDALLHRKGRCPQCGARFVFAPTADGDKSNAIETRIAAGAVKETADAPCTSRSAEKAAPAARGDDRLPARIGRFEIRQKLGAGAFGTVYRAYDPQLDREVALKVPQAGVLDNPTRVERFLREARSAAQLRHPHIVPVYDAGRDGDLYYIASAYIAGRTLADALDDRPMEFRRAARIARELADALEHAHGQRIVHRDVKPANVMLDAEDRPQLMDFGLAQRHDVEDKLTHDGAVMGTPAYMAPEQAAGKSGDAGPASDQYALGVVLYQILTGHLPFMGPAQVVLYNVLNQEPPSPRKFNPKAPIDLETICLKAMAKRAKDRYASCRAMADDLRRWLEGEPIQARRMGLAERLMRWGRRNPAAAIAGGAIVACVTAVAVIASIYAGWLAVSEHRANDERDKATAALKKAEDAAAAEAEAHRDADAQRREAEGARDKLQTALADAEDARGKAQSALADAEQERAKAVDALAKVEAANAKAAEAAAAEQREREKEKAALAEGQWVLYTGLLTDAHSNSGDQALRALDACPEDLRGWEWLFLSARAKDHTVAVKSVNPKAVGQTTGHPELLPRITFSPEGKLFAANYFRDKITVFEGATNKELCSFNRHHGEPLDVAFGPGERVVSCSEARSESNGAFVGSEILIWEAREGHLVATAKGPPADARCVAFGPNGLRIAYGCKVWDKANGRLGDNEILLCDAATGEVAVTLVGHTAPISSLKFSGDGKRLASAAEDGTVKTWNLAAAKEEFTLTGHTDRVNDIAYSTSGERLVSCGRDHTVRIWDAATGKDLLDITDKDAVAQSAAFTTDDQRVVVAWTNTVRHVLKMYDAATGRFLVQINDDGTSVGGRVAFSPDGAYLGAVEVTTPLDQPARSCRPVLFVAAGNAAGHSVRCIDNRSMSQIAFDPDGKRLIGGDWQGLLFFDVSSGLRVRSLPGERSPFAMHPDGTKVAFNANPAPHVRSLSAGLEPFTIRTPQRQGFSIALGDGVRFSPDGQWLAVGARVNILVPQANKTAVPVLDGGAVVLYDAQTGNEAAFSEQPGVISCLAFSPDSRRVASGGSKDDKVHVWDIKTVKDVFTLLDSSGEPPHLGQRDVGVRPLEWSSDGKWIASNSKASVRVWDASNGQTYRDFAGSPTAMVQSVSFSPDGKRIVSCAVGDNVSEVKVWDVESGKVVRTFDGSLNKPTQVVFSPDGQHVGILDDGHARIWELPKD